MLPQIHLVSSNRGLYILLTEQPQAMLKSSIQQAKMLSGLLASNL